MPKRKTEFERAAEVMFGESLYAPNDPRFVNDAMQWLRMNLYCLEIVSYGSHEHFVHTHHDEPNRYESSGPFKATTLQLALARAVIAVEKAKGKA